MANLRKEDYPKFSAAWWVVRSLDSEDPARHGFFQTLQRYNRALNRGEREFAVSMFDVEPPVTEVEILDKGIAASALYYSRRDGWASLPDWVLRRYEPMSEWWAYGELGDYEAGVLNRGVGDYKELNKVSTEMCDSKIFMTNGDMLG